MAAKLPPTPPTTREPKLEGWTPILAVLDELGWSMTRFSALRLSTRRVRPLPIDGYERRPFSLRSALVKWVADERKRLNRSPFGEQLGLFEPPREPHRPHEPHEQ